MKVCNEHLVSCRRRSCGKDRVTMVSLQVCGFCLIAVYDPSPKRARVHMTACAPLLPDFLTLTCAVFALFIYWLGTHSSFFGALDTIGKGSNDLVKMDWSRSLRLFLSVLQILSFCSASALQQQLLTCSAPVTSKGLNILLVLTERVISD